MRFVVAYLATAVVFLGLDALWLSRIALSMYRREIGGLLLDKPNLLIAGLFYLIFVVGIVLLAIFPALNGGTWVNALLMGAVLGLVAYGTYDITNLSTLKGWSTKLAVIDISPAALEHSRRRLGTHAQIVEWHATDVTTFAPSSLYEPLVGTSRQPRMAISVLLPEPDGPMMAIISPFWMCRLTPSSARTSWSPN